MLDFFLREDLIANISLLVVILVIFNYYNKFQNSVNITALGLTCIGLKLLLTISFNNYALFFISLVYISYISSIISYFLSFPNKPLINISIGLLMLLVPLKLILVLYPENETGIDTSGLINNIIISENRFLPPLFLILSLGYTLLFYYDYNGPLKVGIKLLSTNNDAHKYISIKKTFLIALFSTRTALGVLLFSLFTLHKNSSVFIADFDFTYLFEIMAYMLFINSFKYMFKFDFKNPYVFVFLYFVIPLIIIYTIELVNISKLSDEASKNLINALIWFFILLFTFISSSRNKIYRNVYC